jgi:hypothetical protein
MIHVPTAIDALCDLVGRGADKSKNFGHLFPADITEPLPRAH